jgi:hypothetical protein
MKVGNSRTVITIYFDTSFFINLGEADENESIRVINGLNHCCVRYVKSPVVFMELARRHDKAVNHSLLLGYLEHFALPPLEIEDRDWSMLRPGPGRADLAELMRGIDESDVYVRAVCSAANHPQDYMRFLGAMFGDDAAEMVELIHREDPDLVVRVHNEVIRRKNPSLLTQLGEVRPSGDIEKNQLRVIRHSAQMARLSFESAGIAPPSLPDFDAMTPLEAGYALVEWMSCAMGKEMMDLTANRHQLDAETTRGSNRGLKLMEGSISIKSKKRFASSLRDCGHMAVFATFANDIDYLQVDGPKLNEIRGTMEHYLRKLDLGDRCFAATTLQEILTAVRPLAGAS